MALVKKMIELPKDTLDAFEQKVQNEKQGELLASLIEQWLNEQAREALRKELIECGKYMSDVALEVERDFNPMDEELHRAVEY